MDVRLIAAGEMEDVYRLTYRAYQRVGYCEEKQDARLIHYPHLDGIPETIVFGAWENGRLVGTNSLTVDGPAGLHVDEDFPREVSEVRQFCHNYGKNLGASWRIVTEGGRLEVLLRLIHATVMEGVRRRLHVTLYSFNPRHENFYHRLVGLETLARGQCTSLNNSPPSVLMMGRALPVAKAWKRVCDRSQLDTTDLDSFIQDQEAGKIRS